MAAKALGGVQFQHLVAGEGSDAVAAGRTHATSATVQWACFRALLRACCSIDTLTVPSALAASVLPAAFGFSRSSAADVDKTDWLEGRTGELFDPLGACIINRPLITMHD